MAVDSTTGRPGAPVRTCVGCRSRAAKFELLRVVAGPDGTLAVDPRGRLPGRGAHVHPDLGCVDLAERRKAFQRALRLAGPLDLSPLTAFLNDPTREE
jgi:predicted RNA-binding protein YlxR (DUF448 family)